MYYIIRSVYLVVIKGDILSQACFLFFFCINYDVGSENNGTDSFIFQAGNTDCK